MNLTKEQENYCRISMLIVDVVTFALRSLLEFYLTKTGQTLELLLNGYKHHLFHLYANQQCQNPRCKVQVPNVRILTKNQLSILYDTSVTTDALQNFGKFTFCPVNIKTTSQLDVTLLRVILKTCCLNLFWDACLQTYPSLDKFLDSNMHDIYHLYDHKPCCKCNQLYKFPSEKCVLSKQQFKKLFPSQASPTCGFGVGCIVCSLSASPKFTLRDIDDDKLSNDVLDYTCDLKKTVNRLAEQRNNVYAHAKEAKFDDSNFNEIWTMITDLIIKIAIYIRETVKFRTEIEKIENLSCDTSIYHKMLKIIEKQKADEADLCEEIKELKKEVSVMKEALSNLPSELAKHSYRVSNGNEIYFDKGDENNIYTKCDPCDYRNENERAILYCMECSEACCSKCEITHKSHRALRNHRLVDIKTYHMTKHVKKNADRICPLHSYKLSYYCTSHEEPICVSCIQKLHKNCETPEEIIKVAEITRSIATKELDKYFGDLKGVVRQFKDQTVNNFHTLEEKHDKVKNEVNKFSSEFKLKLTLAVDNCENETESELHELKENLLSDLRFKLNFIEMLENNLIKLTDQWNLIRNDKSDLEIFFEIRNLTDMLSPLQTKLQQKLQNHHEIDLSFSPSHCMDDLLSTFNQQLSIGEIVPVTTPHNICFPSSLTQAQCHLRMERKIKSINVEFSKNIPLGQRKKSINMYNSVMISENLVGIADEQHNQILILDTKNASCTKIKTLCEPYDIVSIGENKLVASFGNQKFILTINLLDKSVDSKVQLESQCWGLSFLDGNIYMIAYPIGILVMNSSCETTREITLDVQGTFFLSAYDHCLYYSSWKNGSLECIDIYGNKNWQFKDPRLKSPHGITNDIYGNIFVTGYDSNNVFVVSPDKSLFTEILCETHGIVKPLSICYDAVRNQLLVVASNKSKECTAMIFNIK